MATVWQGTPAELLDDLGHAIAEQYRTIADALEVQLRRALEQAIVSPPDLVARLRVARDLERQARELVATMPPDKIAAAVTSIVSGEASAEIARQLLQIPSLAGTTVTAGGLLAVAAIEIELRDSLRALNARILRAPADAYQRMTAATVPAMLAGRSTWQQVQRRQVDGYLADGISGFTDNSGRRWRIGSYAEMATRTAAARAWRDQSVASMAGAGIETFTPVIGADACAACGAWAGKVLTNGGQTGRVMVPHAITAEPTELVIDATIDAARSAGWGHPNCRCVLVAALPGLSRKQLTTHDPGRETARDKMRALERDVRDAKRDGSPDDVKSAQSALRAHSKQHGLARRSFREQLGFSDGLGGGGTTPPRATAPKAPQPKPYKPAARTARTDWGSAPTHVDDAIKGQGWGVPVQQIDDAAFDAFATPHPRVYRGVTAGETGATARALNGEFLNEGTPWLGNGVYGQGWYTSDSLGTANTYAAKQSRFAKPSTVSRDHVGDSVVEMVLRPEARIANLDQLGVTGRDTALAAATLGFDAVRIPAPRPGEHYYLILNRSALVARRLSNGN